MKAFTGLALFHGVQPLQDEGLRCCLGLVDREGGNTHWSGLDGGFGTQNCVRLQRGRTWQNLRRKNRNSHFTKISSKQNDFIHLRGFGHDTVC